MITRYDMFVPLLQALPGFRPQWQAFVAEWTGNPHNAGGDPRDLPNYLLLGDLADHLCDLMEAGQEADVAAALAVCERWIEHGDSYVANAALAGLLEDLENAAVRRRLDVERFTPMLGPRGRDWWEKWTQTGAWAPSVPQPQPVVTLDLPEPVQRLLDERARGAGRVRGTYARRMSLAALVASPPKREPGDGEPEI